MSKLYGTVTGASQTAATRRGHSLIKSSVQSYNGSLISSMSYKGDKLMLELCVSNESSAYGRRIFYGPFEDFVNKFEKEG